MDRIERKLELLDKLYELIMLQEDAIKYNNENRLNRLLEERTQIFEEIDEIDKEIGDDISEAEKSKMLEKVNKIAAKNEENINKVKALKDEAKAELKKIGLGKEIKNSAYQRDNYDSGYYLDSKN